MTNLGYSCNISVEISAHVRIIREDEGSLWVQTSSNDILPVLPGVMLEFIYFPIRFADEIFFIYVISVRHLETKIEGGCGVKYEPSVSMIIRGASRTSDNHFANYWRLAAASRYRSMANLEWHHMANVHCFAAGPTTCVDKEWFLLLVSV